MIADPVTFSLDVGETCIVQMTGGLEFEFAVDSATKNRVTIKAKHGNSVNRIVKSVVSEPVPELETCNAVDQDL